MMNKKDRTRLYEAARDVFVAQVVAGCSQAEPGNVQTMWDRLEAIAETVGVDANNVWESVQEKLARTDPYRSMTRAGY